MKHQRCELCGADLTIYKRVLCLSNLYYNEGLAKAKVRDLSGAIVMLNKSLELNKKNTNARNLLGLVYFEMGEVVSALSSWVISKHFQPKDNGADQYIASVQKNATKLETLNQTIRKYNLALQSAQNANEDLAILQLKKVTAMNPHYIQALQLLALLYLKVGEIERARRYLLRAEKIDVSNTRTLQLLEEIKKMQKEEEEPEKTQGSTLSKSEMTFMPISSYKEEKPNIRAWVNLFIGVLVGVAFGYFLIVPSVKQKLVADLNKDKIDYSEKVSEYNAKISSLEHENETLVAKVEKLQKELDSTEISESDEEIYESLLQAVTAYMEEMKKTLANRRMDAVAKHIVKIKETSLKNKTALGLYKTMKEESLQQASAIVYEEGHALYSRGRYEDSLKKLLEAYRYNKENVNAIYFIGRAYHQTGDYKNARKYYEIIVEKFQGSNRYSEARSRIAQLPQ